MTDKSYIHLDIAEEFRYMVPGDRIEGYELTVREEIDQLRWESINRVVVRDLYLNTYWSATYLDGLTEMQENQGFEVNGDFVEFIQVYPKTVTRIEYVEESDQ